MSARGSNPLNYTFCVLILLFLYSADDVRYPISKNLNPLLNNGFRHRITLPDLDNDNHLFRSGRVVHSGTLRLPKIEPCRFFGGGVLVYPESLGFTRG